jgi:Protein of unknown function (DUF664)
VDAAESLDITVQWRDEVFSLRYIITHMIEEYARHNGHADLLRERIDGTPGSRQEDQHCLRTIKAQVRDAQPDWAFSLERVTGIEPALSAWESVQSPQSGPLSWESGCPRVTVVARRSPGLMAR